MWSAEKLHRRHVYCLIMRIDAQWQLSKSQWYLEPPVATKSATVFLPRKFPSITACEERNSRSEESEPSSCDLWWNIRIYMKTYPPVSTHVSSVDHHRVRGDAVSFSFVDEPPRAVGQRHSEEQTMSDPWWVCRLKVSQHLNTSYQGVGGTFTAACPCVMLETQHNLQTVTR